LEDPEREEELERGRVEGRAEREEEDVTDAGPPFAWRERERDVDEKCGGKPGSLLVMIEVIHSLDLEGMEGKDLNEPLACNPRNPKMPLNVVRA